MDNIRLPLIAEVLKTYRSQAEERALADFVMHICGISHEEARDMSKEQLQNHIANVLTANDPTPLRPRGPARVVETNGDVEMVLKPKKNEEKKMNEDQVKHSEKGKEELKDKKNV